MQTATQLPSPVVPTLPRLAENPINTVLGAAVMALCLALAWVIVFVWRIGPVIATLDASAGQGVHSGDLLALPLVGFGVLVHTAQARLAR